MSTPPELSLILVSYNSLSDLQRCLPTIDGQLLTVDYELIIVDNHQKDGVADWLQTNRPDVIVVQNPVNSGYAGGNNLGLSVARGRWSLLLNPDTELLLGSLTCLLETARQYPQAFINPKLLNPNGTINACGNVMHYTGITTCRAMNQPGDVLTYLHAIPLLSGAAILGPTATFRALGGFNETYFMYFEDTDLSLRARRQGIPLLCEGRAEIVHHYTLSLTATKFYYLERNRLLTLLTVFSRQTLTYLMPALLLTELVTWVYGLRGWSFLKSRFRTYAYLRNNWLAIETRQQENRQQPAVLTDAQLLAGSELTLPFGSLLPHPIGPVVNALMAAIYRLLIPKRLRG